MRPWSFVLANLAEVLSVATAPPETAIAMMGEITGPTVTLRWLQELEQSVDSSMEKVMRLHLRHLKIRSILLSSWRQCIIRWESIQTRSFTIT